jgi:hypothetical protein
MILPSTMSEGFKGARLKIKRANEHIRDIEARVTALQKSNTSRIEKHPQFGTERLIHELTDATAFDDLAIGLGDAVHNLNCALDYSWYQVARKLIPSIVDERTKFPVREKVEELKGWLQKTGKDSPSIESACPKLSDFLLNKIRPYKGGDHAIWPIHVLDNVDKHRLLIPILSSGDIQDFVVVDEYDEPWPGSAIGQIQSPPYVIDLKPGLHFKDKGKLFLWILVKNRKLTYPLRLPPTLFHYSNLIVKVVEALEAFAEAGACF